MKSVRSPIEGTPTTALTGVPGFDEIAGGGLPRGRTMLLMGGPGSSKTNLLLCCLLTDSACAAEPQAPQSG